MSCRIAVTLLALTLSLVAPSGYAEKIKTKDFSGWMKDYDSLVYIQEKNAYMFSNPEKRGKYKKVRLVDVSIYSENAEANKELAKQSADYMRDGVNRIFAEEGVLATGPGPDVAALSLAITGVEKSTESLKAHNLIPVSAVFRGAKAATGKLDTYIDVMFEGEAVDSVTGERLLAIVRKGIGTTDKKSGEELVFEDLVPTLDRWLENYRDMMRDYLATRE